MDTQVILGKNIRAFREKLGFQQEDLADFLGIKRENISYYETGARNVPLAHLKKLSNLFGVTLQDLLSEDLTNRMLNIAFAFRADEFKNEDLEIISEFRKIVKNYIRLVKLEKMHAQQIQL